MRAALALLLFSCSTLTLAAAVGCSGSVAGTDSPSTADASPDSKTGTDGSTVDTGTTTDGGADAGPEYWPSNATNLAADSPGGGFTPQPPPGSACAYGEVHYTVDVATKAFVGKRCMAGATPTDPLQLLENSKTISATEYAKIDAAMRALTPPKDTGCGADKGVYTVTVTTPSGATTLYDSFYICNGGGKTYVDNIDGVFEAFGSLVPIK